MEVFFMAVQKNPYPLRVEDTLMSKFKVIAAENGRSVNKEIEFLMREAVRSYESRFGKITVSTPPKADA